MRGLFSLAERVGLSPPMPRMRETRRETRIPEKARSRFVTTAVYHWLGRFGREPHALSWQLARLRSSVRSIVPDSLG